MMTILLDTQTGKAPGPNGIPGLAYKRYAKILAPAFLEAMDELQAEVCNVPASLGQRIGKQDLGPAFLRPDSRQDVVK